MTIELGSDRTLCLSMARGRLFIEPVDRPGDFAGATRTSNAAVAAAELRNHHRCLVPGNGRLLGAIQMFLANSGHVVP